MSTGRSGTIWQTPTRPRPDDSARFRGGEMWRHLRDESSRFCAAFCVVSGQKQQAILILLVPKFYKNSIVIYAARYSTVVRVTCYNHELRPARQPLCKNSFTDVTLLNPTVRTILLPHISSSIAATWTVSLTRFKGLQSFVPCSFCSPSRAGSSVPTRGPPSPVPAPVQFLISTKTVRLVRDLCGRSVAAGRGGDCRRSTVLQLKGPSMLH